MPLQKQIEIGKLQQLIQQIKQYIKQQDGSTLEFLLNGQDQQKISSIKKQLNQEQLKYLNSVLLKIQSQKKQDFVANLINNQTNIKAELQVQKKQQSEEELQNIQKQYKITGILYGQDYSYPFLDLIQKMTMVYFKRSHPNPFPEISLKMLHSQIQTLFTCIFNDKIQQIITNKKKSNKKSVINSLKQYLFYVFESQYQKFYNFTKVYENIRKSASKKQDNSVRIQQKKQQINISPLTQTNNVEQIQYLTKISQQIKIQSQFKQFTKIKSLNFLYFGQKHLKQLIDPNGNILPENCPKQILQLISFIICRFLRKVILNSIRRKKNNRLQYLKINQHIQSIDVKIAGNQQIQKATKKSQQFIKLDESIQQIAHRTFTKEFYQYDYQTIIPKNIIQNTQKVIEENKQLNFTLPEYIWKNYKQYRIQWIQRITAQQYQYQQISQLNKKKQKGKFNQYSKFIQKNINEFLKSPALVWLKYLTMNHFQSQITINNQSQNIKLQTNQAQKHGRKKIKLQSLSC